MRENGDCILHEIPLKWDSDVFGDSGGCKTAVRCRKTKQRSYDKDDR